MMFDIVSIGFLDTEQILIRDILFVRAIAFLNICLQLGNRSMGFGFFISSVSKNQNVIPIYANLFMFPQYFLSGTFFPKTVLPQSIHWLIEALPLTALNDALRKVAFEGLHLNDCWKQMGILGAWGVVIYTFAIWVFRWE